MKHSLEMRPSGGGVVRDTTLKLVGPKFKKTDFRHASKRAEKQSRSRVFIFRMSVTFCLCSGTAPITVS